MIGEASRTMEVALAPSGRAPGQEALASAQSGGTTGIATRLAAAVAAAARPVALRNQGALNGPRALERLAEMGRLLATAPSVDAALDTMLRRVMAATGAEAAECFLREPQSGEMVLVGVQGRHGSAFRQITRFRPGEGYPGLLVETGEPLLTLDLPADRRYLRDAVRAAGYRAYLCVPLLGRHQVLGSLHIAARRRDEAFGEYLPLLAVAAGPLAVAVARDQAQIGERLAARTAAAAMDTVLAPGRVAADVVAQAMVMAGADGGMLFRPTPASGSLEVLAAAGPYAGLRGAPGETGRRRGPATRRAAAGAGGDPAAPLSCPLAASPQAGPLLLCPSGDTAARCLEHGFCRAVLARLGAAICLPLAVSGQGTGVLCVGWRRSQDLPTRRLAWLGVLATAAARSLGTAGAPGAPGAPAAEAVGCDVPAGTAGGPAAAQGWTAQGGWREWSNAHAAPLAIRCLGGCALARYGVQLGSEVWGRPKFRRLFAYLLTHRRRWVHREEVMEALWPDLAPGAAQHNLRVALSTVRRVLEPDLSAGSASRYLLRRGDLLRLALPEEAWLDMEAFERLSEPARRSAALDGRALHQLVAAVQLYAGDYLPDDLYKTWTMDERQRLLDLYLTVLDRLAAVYAERGQYDLAATYRRLLLARDPASEAAHRGLMADLTATGRSAEALRQYHRCCDVLRRELDAEPLPETTRLYQRIVAGNAV